jgi:hypothetical protein
LYHNLKSSGNPIGNLEARKCWKSNVEKKDGREEKLDKKSTTTALCSEPGPWRILGILILIAALGGCVGKSDKAGVQLPVQNASGEKVTLNQDSPAQGVPANISGQQINTSDSQSNQLRLILRPNGLNELNKIPITLQLMNPRLNETVTTVFRSQSGKEARYQTNITHIANNNWTQNYSLKRAENISFVQMFVQVSENNMVVQRAEWNITFRAPGGEPK